MKKFCTQSGIFRSDPPNFVSHKVNLKVNLDLISSIVQLFLCEFELASIAELNRTRSIAFDLVSVD